MSRPPFLDFHTRLMPGPDAVDRQLALMDELGIDRAVLAAGAVIEPDRLARQLVEGGQFDSDADNDAVLAACDRAAGRLIPFFFANPHRAADRYRERAAEFRGLELSPAVHGIPFADERMVDLVRVAGEFGHPVYTVSLGQPGFGSGDLVELAKRFPDITFVLGHCGFLAVDLHAINQIAPQHNILAETSGTFSFIVKAALAKLGADRVLFGTEHPHQHPAVEVTKYRTLDLAEETWNKVVRLNALRVLGER
ncbi:amidohydrolase family protein [Longispora sp. K20-0274]|uniref:amidohydrolase family protein n=1 Tax=Longispora sp. K20-0274 TaxID=3088255 RepID=UPI00399A4FCD